MRLHWNVSTTAAILFALARAASGQDDPAQAPPYLAVVDGAATVDREDVTEPAPSGAPLVPGDRVRTERGRVEVLFPDGSALAVDEYSSIELQASALLRVMSGRVILVVAGRDDPESAARFQIDTPAATVDTHGPGEYRISVSGPDAGHTELAVVRGSASLVTERGAMPLRAGERSVASDAALPSSPQFFNSARRDVFDRWVTLRRDARMSSVSAQYLPVDLRMHGGTLDRHGAWEYESQYGYVWYPTVGGDWRPYHDGYWSSVPAYGWTWVGLEAWAWPTHHYGRWGHVRSRWFWIPERHWASAWVSWGGAPGYVSWCPLNYHNRPVFGFSVSAGHGWNAWTVVSRDHFGHRRHSVRQYAVRAHDLPRNTPFIAHASAPAAPARAVPRRLVGGEQTAGVAAGRRGGVGSRPGDADRSSRASRHSLESRPASRSAQPRVVGNDGQGRDAVRGTVPESSARDNARARSSASAYSRAPIISSNRADRDPVESNGSAEVPPSSSMPRASRQPRYGGTTRQAPAELPRPAEPWYGGRSRSRSAAPAESPASPPPAAHAPAPAAPQARPDPSGGFRRSPPSAPRHQRPETAAPAAGPDTPPSHAPQRAGSRASPRGGDAQSTAPARDRSRSRR